MNIREYSFDVVVVGSGPAGLAAAVEAARDGLNVALIERNGAFGGNMTSGAVCHLLGGRWFNPKTEKMERKIGGLFDEITDSLIKKGEAVDPDVIDVHNNPFGWYPRMAAGVACNIEALKRELDELIINSGITPFLFTQVISVNKKGKRIESITAIDQSGEIIFKAPVFIDATGEAQVAFLAECKVQKGRKEDGLTTPATLIMHVENVDMEKYVRYQNEHNQPKLIDIITRLREEGIWKFPFEIFIAIELNDKDVCMVNTVRQVGVDGTDGLSITKAMIEGRKISFELLKIMKEYFPGFENARMRFTADRIGIRETRRIVGKYMVSLEDALSGRRYPDEVIKTTYNFDLPDPLRPSFDPMLGSVSNPNSVRKHVGIYAPYRSFITDEVENLLVAGRCISVEREVLGPMRVTGPAMMGGQAVGIAASLSIKEGVPPNQLDGTKVKSKMIQAGLLLV